MRKILIGLMVFIFIGATTQNLAHSSPNLQDGPPAYPDCEAGETQPICVVQTTWDAATLETRENDVTVEGDEITIVYEDAEADLVLLSGGIQTLLYPVRASDLWAIKLHIENAAAAEFSYYFIPYIGRNPQRPADFHVWRGPDAPEAPPVSDPLQGKVETIEFESEILGATRTLEVYTPPNHDPAIPTKVLYLSDGYVVTNYAPIVEAQILDGALPPVLLVGAYPGSDPTRRVDVRANEYLPGLEPDTFARHEQFFLTELIPWAETTYGASPNREDRAVFGLSNGAGFSAYMGTYHPNIFGAAIVFSMAWRVDYEPPADAPPVRYYLQAGTLETVFYEGTTRWLTILEEAGVETVFYERVAGHDSVQWEGEIGEALVWVFGE